MNDWIDQMNAEHETEELKKRMFWSAFPAMATRGWQAITAQIKRDADKLNKTAQSAMKGEIRINGRELIPSDDTLNVDNLTFPALYVDVRLDTGAKSIHIHQLRRESFEGHGTKTDERLLLDLDDINDLIIRDTNGKTLTVEDVSQHVLRRFLNR